MQEVDGTWIDRDFQMGGWHVSPSLLEIRHRDGQRRTIRKREMSVLVALAEGEGRVVSTQDLIDRVWGERFVQKQVLTNTIFELRRALEESAQSPVLIGTVARVGYRLLVKPMRVERDEHADASALPGDRSNRVADGTAPLHPESRTTEVPWGRSKSVAVIAGLVIVMFATYTFARHHRARALAELGRELLDRRQYPEAIERLTKALNLTPNNASLLDSLANAHDILGEKELARKRIRRAIALTGDEVESTKYERRLAQIDGDTHEELRLLRKGLQLAPRDPYWSFKLGWFYYTHERDCGKSVRHYARAIELSRDPNTLSYYGETLTACRQFARAEVILQDYSSAVDDDADALDLLGTLYALQRRFDKAESYYNRAIAARPHLPEACLHLGVLQALRGDHERAATTLEHFRREVESANGDGEAYVALAWLETREGVDLALALDYAERAIENKPETILGRWVRGLVYVAIGDLETATSDLRYLQSVHGSSRQWRAEYAYHLQAVIAAAQGEAEVALDALERCRALGGTDLMLPCWSEYPLLADRDFVTPLADKTVRSTTAGSPRPGRRATARAPDRPGTPSVDARLKISPPVRGPRSTP